VKKISQTTQRRIYGSPKERVREGRGMLSRKRRALKGVMVKKNTKISRQDTGDSRRKINKVRPKCIWTGRKN